MKKLSLNRGILASLFFAVILLFNSCQKDNHHFYPAPPGEVFDNSKMVNASFIGQVLGEDGLPISNALVKTGNRQILTDADGFFFFPKINTPENATLITVEKASYFKAFRTVHVIKNSDNQVRIMLLDKGNPQTVSAANGGTITIANGGSVVFGANTIINEATNAPYSGTVTVYAKWINPSDINLNMQMPGDLRGINSASQQRVLSTYGMQVVELYDGSGNKLQIAPGKTAQLSFPIAANQLSGAPSSIPLWSFDESNGMWREEGAAQKIGTEYVGAVKHFSYWNCDDPFTLVNFQATFVDTNNNPIVGALVKLTIPAASWNNIGTGYTNSTGTTSGQIPQNTTFQLQLFGAGPCASQVLHTQMFTTALSNVNLGTIVVTVPAGSTTINGSVADCNSAVLANAPVKIKVNNIVYPVTADASGNFSLVIPCAIANTAADITAYDIGNSVNGTTSVPIIGGSVNNIGTVQACGVLNQFINWTSTVGSTPTSFSILEAINNSTFYQYYQLNTGIYGSHTTPPLNEQCSFNFDGPQTVAGLHNLVSYYDHLDSTSSIVGTPVVTLTKYQVVGGFVEGSFNANVTGPVLGSRTINCSFRVIRNN